MRKYGEEEAVRELFKLAKRWPSDKLGLFSWSGTLCVVRLKDGELPSPDGGFSEEGAVVARIYEIPNDGGDPT